MILITNKTLCRDYLSKGIYVRKDGKIVGIDWEDVKKVSFFRVRSFLFRSSLLKPVSFLAEVSLYAAFVLCALAVYRSSLWFAVPLLLFAVPLLFRGILKVETERGAVFFLLKDREVVDAILSFIPEEKREGLLKDVRNVLERF